MTKREIAKEATIVAIITVLLLGAFHLLMNTKAGGAEVEEFTITYQPQGDNTPRNVGVYSPDGRLVATGTRQPGETFGPFPKGGTYEVDYANQGNNGRDDDHDGLIDEDGEKYAFNSNLLNGQPMILIDHASLVATSIHGEATSTPVEPPSTSTSTTTAPEPPPTAQEPPTDVSTPTPTLPVTGLNPWTAVLVAAWLVSFGLFILALSRR